MNFPEAKFETTDADATGVALAGLGVGVLLGGVILTCAVFMGSVPHARWKGQPVPPVRVRGIENDSGERLREVRGRELARLRSYAWVNREHGIARIPIERAMQLTVKGAP